MLALALALALSQQPADPADSAAIDPLYKLGLSYLTVGDARKAVPPLEQLLKKDPDNLDGKLMLARAYQGAGQQQKAKELLDKAILANPEEPSLRAQRGQLARSLEDFESAVLHYKKAVELSPADAQLTYNLAEALHFSSRPRADAIAMYLKALELNPRLVEAKVNLGKAYAEKGEYSKAKETLLEATRLEGADAEAHYNLGVIFMRENNLVAALSSYEAALKLNPRHAQALNNMGVALDAKGEPKRALDYFKQSALADPTFAEAFFNQGMSYMRLNRQVEATKAFEQALKLEPASSSPYVQLGGLYLKQGKADRAEQAFKKALELQEAQEKDARPFLQLKKRLDREANTDAYRGLAMALLAQGKVDDAVVALKRAVEKLPKDASARVALGEAYLSQGNLDGAVEQLTTRLALEPTAEAKLDLARAYAKKRVAKQAEPLYKDVLKAEPDNRAAKMGLVDLWLSMGRFGEAELALKDAVAKDPHDAQALARLGIMKSRMGRPDQALEPLEKAVELNASLYDARAELTLLYFRADASNAERCVRGISDILLNEPRHVLSRHYLGICLYGLGQKDKAEEAFKAALQIDASYAPAHFQLGDLYEQDGKKEEAKKAYEAAAKLDHAEARDALKRLNAGK